MAVIYMGNGDRIYVEICPNIFLFWISVLPQMISNTLENILHLFHPHYSVIHQIMPTLSYKYELISLISLYFNEDFFNLYPGTLSILKYFGKSSLSWLWSDFHQSSLSQFNNDICSWDVDKTRPFSSLIHIIGSPCSA